MKKDEQTEEKIEGTETEEGTENSGDGDESETNEPDKKLQEENTRLQKENARLKQGGSSEAGKQPEKPKKLSDEEYADALQRGEVNPMKDDGFT